MFDLIFSAVTQALSSIKRSLSRLVSFLLLKKQAETEVTNAILKKELIKNRDLIRRIIDVKKKEAEIAAQPSPDVNAINEWLLKPRDKD